MRAGVFGDSPGYLEGDIQLVKDRGAPRVFHDALGRMCKGSVYYENGPLMRCRQTRNVQLLARFSGSLRTYAKHPRKLRRHLQHQHDTGALVVCRLGRGCVVLMSPHPELTAKKKGILSSLLRAARKWSDER